MKKQLHIKKVDFGFMVAYKDGIWYAYSGETTRDNAKKIAKDIIKKYPNKFIKTVCDCGTTTES